MNHEPSENTELLIPPEIDDLLAVGIWPKTHEASCRQNGCPLVSTADLQRLIPEEDQLYLLAPPFRNLWDHDEPADWYGPQKNRPSLMNTQLLLMIANFEIGVEAFIALDYQTSRERPSVLYFHNSYTSPSFFERLTVPALRGRRFRHGTYRQIAPDFRTFAEAIGLL